MSIYTRGNVIEFVEKIFGAGSLTNQGVNISVVCPICQQAKGGSYAKRKLAIRTDNFIVHCWVCGYKSRNILDLISRFHPGYFQEYISKFVGSKHIRPDDFSNVSSSLEETKPHLPTGFILLADTARKSWNEERPIEKYLGARFGSDGISYGDLWYWKFGFSTEDPAYVDRVIFPSFDANGELNYFTARTIKQEVLPKYLNPPVFREDVIFNEINLDWSEPITIVEGPFDLIKCNNNATCLLGSDLTTEYQLFQMLVKHRTPVTLALDPDAKDKAIKIAGLLNEYGVSVSLLDIPSPFKDVGEMSRIEFNSILKDATLFNRGYSLKCRIANLLNNI